MKFTIKDKRFIQKNNLVIDYIREDFDGDVSKLLLKGLSNIDKIEENKTVFEYVDYRYDGYLLVTNKTLGAFIVREDNLNEIVELQDVLEINGIDKIIRNGDKTILIDIEGNKYITTRQEEDEYDLEKAVMILMLKANGYSVKDIYDIIASVR